MFYTISVTQMLKYLKMNYVYQTVHGCIGKFIQKVSRCTEINVFYFKFNVKVFNGKEQLNCGIRVPNWQKNYENMIVLDFSFIY